MAVISAMKKWFALSDTYPREGVIQVWQILGGNEVEVNKWNEHVSDLICPKCSSTLSLNSYLIDDIAIFTDGLAEIISSRLNEEIQECQWCNSDIIVFEQKHGDPFKLNTVYSLLDENEISDDLGELYEEVASRISCKCGQQLDLDYPYVTREELDYWYGDRDTELIMKTFDIHEYAARKFIEYIYKYPMLGLNSLVGKEIYTKINSQGVDGMTSLESGTVLYRARKRNTVERHVPFVTTELWAPPPGIPGHGRFNPVGVQVLYLCDTPETGMKEIGLTDADEEVVAEVAEFVLLEDLRIWDVRNLDINVFTSMPSMNKRMISKEYLLPNFFAQCCSVSGINGILYGSVKTPEGWNIALLNYRENKSIVLNNILEAFQLNILDSTTGNFSVEGEYEF